MKERSVRLSVLVCAIACLSQSEAVSQTTVHGGRIVATDVEPMMLYSNPAAMTTRQDSTQTDFSVGYASSRGHVDPAHLVGALRPESYSDGFTTSYQDGSSWQGWGFDANAYVKKDASKAVWGAASYQNGERGNVLWNETSDYRMTYPFCVADTVGGDMEREAYRFMAGAAWHSRPWGLGVEIDYASAVEYREHDPRPKNNSLFARVNVGTAVRLSPNRKAGLYVSLAKYSQENDIDFYNPYGKSSLYQLSGLGTAYLRFSTVNDETVYKGHIMSAGLTWATADRKGVNASVAVSRYTMEKILPDLNNTPINNIEQYEVSGEIAYGMKVGGVGMRPSASFVLHDRKGEELYYDDGSQNYHEIARSTMYSHRLMDLKIGSVADLRSSGKGLSASLSVRYRAEEEEILFPDRSREVATMSGEAMVGGWLQAGRCTWSCDMLYRHRGTLTSSLDLPVVYEQQFTLEDAVQSKGFGLSTDQIDGAGVSLRCDVGLLRYMRSLFLKFDWRIDHRKEAGATNHALALSLGLVVN